MLKLQIMDLNLDKRTKVLEYALHLEESINLLLLLCLGIHDNAKTKLFGNKAGISFQSKIDLLFDIDILDKEEHQGLELQMNFRNKFLHDIKFNSFILVLSYFDNGIRNRFKKYLLDGGDITDEESCNEAYQNLCLSNLKVILKKIDLKENDANDTMDILLIPEKIFNGFMDSFLNLCDSIFQQIENVDLDNAKAPELAIKIISTCNIHKNKLLESEIIKSHKEYYLRLSNLDKMRNIFK
jgi:hypothetical protein